MNDTQLLQSFTNGSETAFRELVERHLPLVLGTARRLTRDDALAEDVAQTVFILLARKANSFGPGIILSGWLHRSTRFVAARAMSSEQRRRRREEQAADMYEHSGSDPLWENIKPHLDDALSRLGEMDRNALLLRFFNDKPLREVGAALGISEDAAKKRVTRAVEKLRTALAQRGKEISAAALIAGLSQPLAEAAYPPLVARISDVAQRSVAGIGAGAASALLLDVLAALRWAKIKIGALVAVSLVALIGTVSFLSDAQPKAPEKKLEAQSEASRITEALKRSRQDGKALTNGAAEAAPDLAFRHVKVIALDGITSRPIPGVEVTYLLQDGPKALSTDTNGSVRVPIPYSVTMAERMNQFQVWLKKKGYGQREIMWLSTTGQVLNVVSSEYTVRMNPGISLAATVVDESDTFIQVINQGYGSPALCRAVFVDNPSA